MSNEDTVPQLQAHVTVHSLSLYLFQWITLCFCQSVSVWMCAGGHDARWESLPFLCTSLQGTHTDRQIAPVVSFTFINRHTYTQASSN